MVTLGSVAWASAAEGARGCVVKMTIGAKAVFFAVIFTALALGGARAGGGWSGFYAGGNVGYAWGNAEDTSVIADGPGVACHFCFADDIGLAQGNGSPSFNPKGFTGGAQIGYNWQVSNLVYGAELDVEAFSQRQTVDSSFTLPTASAPANSFCGFGVNCVGNFSTSVKADWLITLRPRLGYAANSTLVYVTGGLAIAKLSLTQSYSDNIVFGVPPSGSVTASASQTKIGWVVGAGLEQAIGDRWSLKAEYLYARFDGINTNGTLVHNFGGGNDFATFSNNLDHLSTNIIRVGFNYRFGATNP